MLADVLRMTVWQTPAGIVDEGGMILQAWLNFGITLVAPPANGLMHVCAASPVVMPRSYLNSISILISTPEVAIASTIILSTNLHLISTPLHA